MKENVNGSQAEISENEEEGTVIVRLPRLSVKKRDGQVVPFTNSRIMDAVRKAAKATDHGISDDALEKISGRTTAGVMADIALAYAGKDEATLDVEEIQDLVEKSLMDGHPEIAKAYILYRQKRNEAREMRGYLMKQYHDIISVDSIDSDDQRENANIDADGPMGSMLKIGSTSAKHYYLQSLISPKYAEMHREGAIHLHDMDFYGTTINCVQIDLTKLFKKGFKTGHGYIRTPQDIRSYAALACIAVQSSQNMFFGGQAIPNLEYDLAPGFRKEFAKRLAEIEAIATGEEREFRGDFEEFASRKEEAHLAPTVFEGEALSGKFKEFLAGEKGYSDDLLRRLVDSTPKALKMARRECDQALEAMVHNLCTMSSRAGAQVPFSSVSFGTGTTLEQREICWSLLHALDKGLGHHETAIFPVTIMRVLDGVNYRPGDPNYDIYREAMRVSAKRLFPNFEFLNNKLNEPYIKMFDTGEYDHNTFAAVMGCARGDSVAVLRQEELAVPMSMERLYARLELLFSDRKAWGGAMSEYVDVSGEDIQVIDSSHVVNRGGRDFKEPFVKLLKVIRNRGVKDWVRVDLGASGVLEVTPDHPLPVKRGGEGDWVVVPAGELKPGDVLRNAKVADGPYLGKKRDACVGFDGDAAWATGAMLAGTTGVDEHGRLTVAVPKKDKSLLEAFTAYGRDRCDHDSGESFVEVSGPDAENFKYYEFRGAGNAFSFMFNFGTMDVGRTDIPTDVFWCDEDGRNLFVAGVLDMAGDVFVRDGMPFARVAFRNRAVARQFRYVVGMYGIDAAHPDGDLLSLEFPVVMRMLEGMKGRKALEGLPSNLSSGWKDFWYAPSDPGTCEVLSVEPFQTEKPEFSYDVETESGYFDLNGIVSHNCRTRVLGNVNGPETTPSRGNLSFTTINLVQPAIRNRGDVEGYMTELRGIAEDVIGQLLERYDVQRKLKGRNLAFVFDNKTYMNSEGIGMGDPIEEAIKNGTLSIGFIGLAEALLLLVGKHHGEDDGAQKLGLEIVGILRSVCDEATAKHKLNFSLIGSPAEGLSGRFTRIDRQKYGVIEGITSKEYYTNSSHVPVWYKTSIQHKIEVEAPYHLLCNAGAIAYVEIDGDATQNLEAFDDILKCMHDSGVAYGAVNHPDDHDPVCGYHGVIHDTCPSCGRKATRENPFVRIRRVTGYLANVDARFNNAKKAEEHDRVKHD